MKTSLPEIHIEMDSSSSTRYNLAMKDFTSKAKQKEFPDQTRKTQPHSLTVGDTVLVRQKKTNKLTPPYIPKPYKVADVKGSMVTAKRGTHRIVRNSSYFKQIPINRLKKKRRLIQTQKMFWKTSQRHTSSNTHSGMLNQDLLCLPDLPELLKLDLDWLTRIHLIHQSEPSLHTLLVLLVLLWSSNPTHQSE
ncbi:transposon Ty3-G Gag-Pol polyprotein [Elysia marginata]|uniref:Transposon Ty3-G Gag-Pol polyprotein n=1 Tax=Elysia marginata TaxID=1093978 RepID=A0AAV4HK29_9GAST|nr:transposon Ty3-G Gag-Pol polyprotein [Elysia marginata]